MVEGTTTVEPGDIVVIHYVGRLAEGDGEGTVFDTSDVDVALQEDIYYGHRDYKPLTFEVGAGEVFPLIDEAVRTMALGEVRTITVDPADAYSDRDESRVVEVPRESLEAQSGRDAHPWRPVHSETGELGWITAVSEQTVTVDFNHDLAGARLEFELRLLDVRKDDA